MEPEFTRILIPKETVSDDVYQVIELPVRSGTQVSEGDIIGCLETSKADLEIEAPASGYLHYTVQEGDDMTIGSLFAVVSNRPDFPAELFQEDERTSLVDISAQTTDPKALPETGVRISKPARALIDKYRLDLSAFAGKKLIRQSDVIDLLNRLDKKESDKSTISTKGASVQNAILIVGDGGHAHACIDLIRQLHQFSLAGLIGEKHSDRTLLDAPVIGTNADLASLFHEKSIRYAVVGIGALNNPLKRMELFHTLKTIGYELPNLIHPKAIIEPSVSFGQGNQVFAGAIIGSNARIESNCIINAGTVISHDCILEHNVHLTPGATLAGAVHIKRNTIIGMNASVYLGATIGQQVVINNNVAVYKDVADGTIVK